jgi:hypothetical protein
MRRVATICAAGLVLAASPAAAASSQPRLVTVAPGSGHLMLSFTVGDLTPLDVQATSTGGMPASRAFPRALVKLQERMRPPSQSGVVRWRTAATLPAGIYFVHVSAALSGGVTSCVHATNCLVRWSNVVRVQVP